MKNWAGNIVFDAQQVVSPKSLSEAQQLISDSSKVRALGTRHSFSRIADAETILDTRKLPEFVEIGADRTSVRVNGSMTYGRLVELLAPSGLTLSNFASLPHISIAGAVATGTHGSGSANQNLAALVNAVQLITGTGELVEFARGEVGFDGAAVSLGALGLVTALSIDVEPAFMVSQSVYEELSIESLLDHFDAVFDSAYSVSAFTRWRDIEQLWVKGREGHAMPEHSKAVFADLASATQKRHPIRELDPQACTDQLGVPGPAIDRLPHFKLEFTPSAGDEIQSEFFVDRRSAADAIRAVAAIQPDIANELMVSELRTVRGDTQWMSPHVGRDSLAIHFTWNPDQRSAEDAARRVVDALGPFEPRAHWGKVFDRASLDMAQYEQRPQFISLVESLDANRTFTNDWFDSIIG